MFRRVLHLPIVFMGAWIAATSIGFGQHADSEFGSGVTGDVPALLERLEAAERRIHQLETSRLPHTGSSQLINYYNDDNGRLSELEKAVKKTEDGLKDLKSSLGGKVSSGHSSSKMKVSGRVHFDYWGFGESDPGINVLETDNPDIPPQDRFAFRRLRFGVAGDVWENMNYKIEMEFAGGNNVEFRDAYLGWKHLPLFHTVLLGNQKRPYGLDHLNSSRYNVFVERPFIIEGNNQDARRFGLCSYGVSENERWNWRFGVFNPKNVQSSGSYINNDLQLEFAARLANTIWYDECSDGRGYAHWAISGSIVNTDENDVPLDDFDGNQARFRTRPEARSSERWLNTGFIDNADYYGLLGFEAVLNLGPFSWVAEYQPSWVYRTGDLSDLEFNGGYMYVAYWLTGEHTPWERDSGTLGRTKPFENFFLVDRCCGGLGHGWGAWQVAARWSYADYNDENILGGYGEAFTFGVNWWWNPYARVQFNYIYGDISDRNSGEEFGIVDGDYQIYGTRFMIDF